MDSSRAVRARGVGKAFGDVVALDSVDLDVSAGQIHGLVGPNGAGKTTLLGLLLGLATADRGELEILGTTIGRSLQVPEGVAGFVDGPGLYPSLTPRQNLRALASLRGLTSARGQGALRGRPPSPGRSPSRGRDTDRVDDVLDQVGLTDVAGDPVRGFSLGMRQRLGLAAALLTQPRLLVLDEPANGLDPAGTRHVHRVLTRLADDGTAVVLSSHRMDDLAALCSEVTILNTGRVVFTGPLTKLAAESGELDYQVRVSRPDAARKIADRIRELRVHGDTDLVRGRLRTDPETIIVRGPVSALDELVIALVGAGIAVRELAPVIAPLEAAFLNLTGDPESEDQLESAEESLAEKGSR